VLAEPLALLRLIRSLHWYRSDLVVSSATVAFVGGGPRGFFLVFTQAAKGAVLRGEVSFLAGGGVNCRPCNGDLPRYP